MCVENKKKENTKFFYTQKADMKMSFNSATAIKNKYFQRRDSVLFTKLIAKFIIIYEKKKGWKKGKMVIQKKTHAKINPAPRSEILFIKEVQFTFFRNTQRNNTTVLFY